MTSGVVKNSRVLLADKLMTSYQRSQIPIITTMHCEHRTNSRRGEEILCMHGEWTKNGCKEKTEHILECDEAKKIINKNNSTHPSMLWCTQCVISYPIYKYTGIVYFYILIQHIPTTKKRKRWKCTICYEPK